MRDTPWDSEDYELAAGDSGIDAFDAFMVGEEADPDVGLHASFAPTKDGDDCLTTVTFTAGNPANTVIVTALMDGKILKIELAPQVTAMTEAELGREIAFIAKLARMQAHAAQHCVIAAMLNRMGHDPAATRSFIERDLQLPSPEWVKHYRAQVLAARYGIDE